MSVTILQRPEGWPVLGDDALYGLPGEVVETIAPHTEADPAALLLTFLVGFGNTVGPGPYIVADGAEHRAVESVVLVGDTSRARKGTSLAQVRPILTEADPSWETRRVSGLASGEGVMARLSPGDDDEDGQVDDVRLFVVESELARLLVAASRDGSILSAVVRDTWDGVPLHHLTKHHPLHVERHHVSILGHVTEDELRARLTKTDVANGFANRFLFAVVTRSKLLPHGGDLDPFAHRRLGTAAAEVLAVSRRFRRIRRTPDADRLWESMYAALAVAPSGPAGQLTARAEAHLLRLSLLYALADGCEAIDVAHLSAAWELYRYCHQSVLVMAGGSDHDIEQRLLDAVRGAGDAGLTGTEQRDLFQRHVDGLRLHQARQVLETAGLAVSTEIETGGRPRLITRATRDQSDLSDRSGLPSLSSLSSQGRNVQGGAA